MSIQDFNLNLPFPDVFPAVWAKEISPCDFMMFRNLDHFRYEVSHIKQKKADNCGMSYDKALNMLLMGKTDFPESEQESIRDLVRSNLHKRGLLTHEVYENFRYTNDGTQVDFDVGKYANGEPDCVMSPSRQYIDFFYELYINISYAHYVTNSQVRRNVAKLLATVEELERQHIYIKVTLLLPITSVCSNRERSDYMATIPLFSHKERKSVGMMSSVVNDRLLRKFFFAVLENLYDNNLNTSYGNAKNLEGTMNIGDEFDEVKFFETVQQTVGV
ncbi:MAG: hypothetical protein GQ576_07115 [Methanococcoides sp.]|nr:hypothetical protein [Methanococcoides sp.]